MPIRPREDGKSYGVDYVEPQVLIPTMKIRVVITRETRSRLQELGLDISKLPEETETTLLAHVTSDIELCKTAGNDSDVAELDFGSERVRPRIISSKIDGVETEVSHSGNYVTIPTQNPSQAVQIEHYLLPELNRDLLGLYTSGNNVITQCQDTGFSNIAPTVDSPDVLTRHEVTMEADSNEFPVMLSNGVEVSSATLPNGRHSVTYRDDYPKPSYLFAIAMGKFNKITDVFHTQNDKPVSLEIYAEDEDMEPYREGLGILKEAMAWDERVFGVTCRLPHYRIVASRNFNWGGMENRGLNVFRADRVRIDPETVTDFQRRSAINTIAHEYAHDATAFGGTAKSWDELTVNEGLTRYREQEFLASRGSPALERIRDVYRLRTWQYPEDASGDSHAIRPESFGRLFEIAGDTVYQKGAEVVRMIRTLIGDAAFLRGYQTYLREHEGKTGTTKEFVQAMESESAMDLSQFYNWYTQKGTPHCDIETSYDANAQTYSVTVRQKPANTDDNSYHFPLSLGLVDKQGRDIPLTLQDNSGEHDLARGVLSVRNAEQTFVFTGITEEPVPSLFRNFSAPVIVDTTLSIDALRHLAMHDSDLFNRYEAVQQIIKISTNQMFDSYKKDGNPGVLPDTILDSFDAVLRLGYSDPGLAAEMLTCPPTSSLLLGKEPYDFIGARNVIKSFRKQIAKRYEEQLVALYKRYHTTTEDRTDGQGTNERTLKNICLEYLAELDDKYTPLARAQYDHAVNMTDREEAMYVLCSADTDSRTHVLNTFLDQWGHKPGMFEKMLETVSRSKLPDIITFIETLRRHPKFDVMNSNHMRGLYLIGFSYNLSEFHHPSGEGYRIIADAIIEFDTVTRNATKAGELAQRFSNISKLDPDRQLMMKDQIQRILATPGISNEVQSVLRQYISE